MWKRREADDDVGKKTPGTVHICISTLKPRLTGPRYSTAAAVTLRYGHASCRRQRREEGAPHCPQQFRGPQQEGKRISELGKQRGLSELYKVERDDRPHTFCSSFATNAGKCPRSDSEGRRKA